MDQVVDVLIIGSGPVGATFARELTDSHPEAKVLLVDAGPQLTARRGFHVRNIADAAARSAAQVASQGPTAYPYDIPSVAQRADGSNAPANDRPSLLARPGTFLLSSEGVATDMPAAAMSSNVGGMGAHWTCACPRPGRGERIEFIAEAEWVALCTRAEELLHVTCAAFPTNPVQESLLASLGSAFNGELRGGRGVGPMPLACTVDAKGNRWWSGADVVLGGLADAATSPALFELRQNTVCLRLETGDHGATGAVLQNKVTGERSRVRAKAYVVAADALRTPQLLWASGLRSRALGHYLNDQPISMALARVKTGEASCIASSGDASDQVSLRPVADATLGVLWVPYDHDTHPFHGQVMHLDTSPIPVKTSDVGGDRGKFVGLGWFCAKDLRSEDCIEFAETETDFYGLPRMTIHYALSAQDQANIERSHKEQERAARAVGEFVEGATPRSVPAGTSLHYQGSTRMGKVDDGSSVCDGYSRLWGVSNVFVGGNNVIPTSTACNPTLSAVALAVRASRQVAELL